jgi:dynein heavy chain
LTLAGALHLQFEESSAGSAGTGKTETVKDLAKALAIFYVVFNFSELVTVFQISNFFRVLTQAGVCSCFDEFNRINIGVLSVIGEQFNCIKAALCADLKRFPHRLHKGLKKCLEHRFFELILISKMN